MDKSPKAFRTISEVAGELNLPTHVLRFWETKFAQVRPLKRSGNRRYYRPEDIELLQRIQHLLREQGYTIKGVQKLLSSKASFAAVMAGTVPDPDPDGSDEPSLPIAGLAAEQAAMASAGPMTLSRCLADLKAIRALLLARAGQSATEVPAGSDSGAVPKPAAKPAPVRARRVRATATGAATRSPAA